MFSPESVTKLEDLTVHMSVRPVENTTVVTTKVTESFKPFGSGSLSLNHLKYMSINV